MKKAGIRILSSLFIFFTLFYSVNLTGFATSSAQKENNFAKNENESVKTIIYNGLKDMNDSIDISEFHLQKDEAVEIYRQTLNDHSDLFYVAHIIEFVYDQSDTLISFMPTYICSREEKEVMASQFETAVEDALSGIHDSMTDLEKALYFHDYLIKICAYDNDNYLLNTVPPVSHSAYGCLVLNTSVCDGYSLAYSYLLSKVGIESRLIIGPGHAWNAIKLNDSYYFVDLTYDDAVFSYSNAKDSDCYDFIRHSYFLLTGEEIKKDGSLAHSSWVQDISVTDQTYTNAAFHNVMGSYGYFDDHWYYLDTSNAILPVIRKTADVTAVGASFYSLADYHWPVFKMPNSYYQGYLGTMDVSRDKIYFCTPSSIMTLSLRQDPVTPEIFHEVDTTEGFVYGLKIIGNILTYGTAKSPMEKETTDILTLNQVTIGDVNGDSAIDASDALCILKIAAKMPVKDFVLEAADTNGDGIFSNAMDALAVLKYAAKIYDHLPQ